MQTEDVREHLLEEVLELSGAAYWIETRPELETLAGYLSQPGWLIAQANTHPYHALLLSCFERLRARIPDPALLGELAADLYFSVDQADSQEGNSRQFDPALNPYFYAEVEHSEERQPGLAAGQVGELELSSWDKNMRSLQRLLAFPGMEHSRDLAEALPLQAEQTQGLRLLRLLNLCIWQSPPRDLEERVKAFLQPGERLHDKSIRGLAVARWVDCRQLLPCLPASDGLRELLVYLRPLHLLLPDPRSLGFYYYIDEQPLYLLISTLFTYNLFSYKIFYHMAFLQHHHLMKDAWWKKGDEALYQQARTYQEILVGESAQNLSEENYLLLLAFERPLSGCSWLLAAAQAYDTLRPGKLIGAASEYSPDTLTQAIIRLARARDVEPTEPQARAELLARLRAFSRSTLKMLFGVAAHARRLLCEALDWQELLPLVDLVERLAEPVLGEDGTSSLDAELDIVPAQAVLARINSDLAEEALAILAQGKAGVENAATLLRALGGWNRASVLRGVKHNGHLSIKAYGLLPLREGEEEVMERYLELQRQVRIGRSFGPSRRANHAAALEIALAHLAQVGSYRDAAHLEWEVEARIVRQATAANSTWTVGTYTLQIALEGAQAAIQITRNGRFLKSVPSEVRASAVYKKEIKEALARMRTHVSRIKKGLLERLLASGEPLSKVELARLLEIPTVRALLSTLICCAEDGTQGLLDPESMSLCDVEGRQHLLSGPIIVAHPYHLYQAETLSAWQRLLIHRRIVQPIKQAFRELYVLTPAEEETATFSRRFENHTLNGSIALRLLAERNWRIAGRSSDQPLAYKNLAGLRASLELSYSGHYLGEAGSITTTGVIRFTSLRPTSSDQVELLPLSQVPALNFSEVMRDIDLIVSVAQMPASQNAPLPGGQPLAYESQSYQSPEIYARTAEIVCALLDELQLPGVTISGHFALVQGKLARYRVHLGSAAIHIEPGGYLCIVPAKWGQTSEQLFLPFANEDTRLGEVISKILLLLADERIKDESILRQIRRTG